MSMLDGGEPTATRLVWRPNTSSMTPRQVQILRQSFAAVARSGTYAEIAGIHGLPLPMYGQHHTGLFLPWHRAYVAMLEKALQKAVGEVAIPAWDWWNESGLPDAFAVEIVDGEPKPALQLQNTPSRG